MVGRSPPCHCFNRVPSPVVAFLAARGSRMAWATFWAAAVHRPSGPQSGWITSGEDRIENAGRHAPCPTLTDFDAGPLASIEHPADCRLGESSRGGDLGHRDELATHRFAQGCPHNFPPVSRPGSILLCRVTCRTLRSSFTLPPGPSSSHASQSAPGASACKSTTQLSDPCPRLRNPSYFFPGFFREEVDGGGNGGKGGEGLKATRSRDRRLDRPNMGPRLVNPRPETLRENFPKR